MRIEVHKNFLKDSKSFPVHIKKKVFDVVNNFSVKDIPKLEKMIGFQNYYKIRVGDYRIGVYYNDEILIFERVQHRKEIYRNFP